MMPPLAQDQLRVLGMLGVTIGAGELLPFPVEVARGLDMSGVPKSLPVLFQLRFQDVHFQEARVGVLEDFGSRIEVLRENPAIVKLIGAPGSTTAFRSLRNGDAATRVDADDPATRYVDLERSGPARIDVDDGNGVLILLETDGIRFFPILRAPVRIDAPSDIISPAEEWCATCDDDWLVEQVRGRLVLHDPWQHGVAAGLYARLFEPQSRLRVRELLDRMRAREPDQDLAAPRLWARSLSAAQLATLEELALVEIDRSYASLSDLEETMAPDEAAWREDLLAVCHQRDDVESVRVLLREAGCGELITAALDALDCEGELLVSSIPRIIRLRDERLRRVLLRDPTAWWSVLAEFEEGGAAVPSEKPTVARRPPWLRIVAAGGRSQSHASEPMVLAAQQRGEPGWPLDTEIDTELEGAARGQVLLRFRWRGFELVVECLQARPEQVVVVQLEALGHEARVGRGGRALLGPLDQFRLSNSSTAGEIEEALLSAGFKVRTE